MTYPLAANCKIHTRNLQKIIQVNCDIRQVLTKPLSTAATHTLIEVQQRLMTYKELKLHEDMLAPCEMNQLLDSMFDPEREIALCGIDCLEFHIRLVDSWLKQSINLRTSLKS